MKKKNNNKLQINKETLTHLGHVQGGSWTPFGILVPNPSEHLTDCSDCDNCPHG